MDHVQRILMIGLGGFVGANARYWLGLWIESRTADAFPWHTLAVNVSGSFFIGAFMGAFFGLNLDMNWRYALAVGLLGGYTTFSAFSFETVGLLENRHFGAAFGYVGASVLLSLLATSLGLALSRLAFGRG